MPFTDNSESLPPRSYQSYSLQKFSLTADNISLPVDTRIPSATDRREQPPPIPPKIPHDDVGGQHDPERTEITKPPFSLPITQPALGQVLAPTTQSLSSYASSVSAQTTTTYPGHLFHGSKPPLRQIYSPPAESRGGQPQQYPFSPAASSPGEEAPPELPPRPQPVNQNFPPPVPHYVHSPPMSRISSFSSHHSSLYSQTHLTSHVLPTNQIEPHYNVLSMLPSGYVTPISPTLSMPLSFSPPPPSGPVAPSLNSGHGSVASLPDLRRLSLSSTPSTAVPYSRSVTRHDACCAGCGAQPIRGEYRWHCLICPNEDLCSNCKEAGVRDAHLFKPVRAWTERHDGYSCNGCRAMPITGIRRECKVHEDEDWCEDCFKSSRCCRGPFTEFRQNPLGLFMEQYGGLLMPKEWQPYFCGPPAATYHMKHDFHEDGWLSLEGRRSFYRKPLREMSKGELDPPAYAYNPFYEHSTFGEDRYKWTFKSNPNADDGTKEKLWDYVLKTNGKSGTIVREEFAQSRSDVCIPGGAPRFQHGPECDSLVFTSPDGRREFRWLTNRPVSNLHGERWDAQLYALFERVDAASNREHIVADMAWWDGHHDSPETAISIRDRSLDHSLVLATLSVLHTHQWRVLAMEKRRCREDFIYGEETARLTTLGRQSYWKSKERAPSNKKAKHGGKGPKSAALLGGIASLELAANVLEIVNKVT